MIYKIKLSVILSFILFLTICIPQDYTLAAGRTVYLTGTWTEADDIYHVQQIEFDYPSTITVSYYDAVTGNTYSFEIPYQSTTTAHTRNEIITDESYGKAQNYNRIAHDKLGYMSDNTSTYYGGAYSFSAAKPRKPEDYYGNYADKTGWKVVEWEWDEDDVQDARDWPELTADDGLMWISDTGTPNRYRKGVYLKYEKDVTTYKYQANYGGYVTIPDDFDAEGIIKFTPNASTQISENRNGWVKNDFNVTVSVVGDKQIPVTGSQSRNYTYWDSCYSTHQSCSTSCSGSGESRSCSTSCTTVCDGAWVNSSTSSSYTEIYKIESLTVTGEGQTASGSTVSLPQRTISDGGTYSVSQELKSITLHGKVTRWISDSVSWNGDSPPRGSWTGPSSPSQNNTTAPTVDYASDSGDYFLDKTAPVINAPNPNGKDWTNQNVNVPLQVTDNLSGLYNTSSYHDLIDNSYYNHTKPRTYFTYGTRNATPTVILSSDGIYQIKINAEDVAKNVASPFTSLEYKIDKTNPKSALFSSDNRQYIDDDLTISVTVGDNLSGVAETRYVLNNHPSDTSGMSVVSATTPERQNSTDTFTVNLTQPGSWWIHVYQKDRAGNVTTTHSREYKIIRLGNANNRAGQTFSGRSDQIWLEPRQTNDKVPRATRFDILMQSYGLTESQTASTMVHLTTPKWVDDNITNKVNGQYAVTGGTTDAHSMNYYSGYTQGDQSKGNPETMIQWWKAFIPPYGTPASLDRNGNRLLPQYQIQVQLEYSAYIPSKTHISTITFDIIPETKIKTEIIKNQY